MGIRVQVVVKFRTWFRVRGGYPCFLRVGLRREGHVKGTHPHPPRAFGGGHSNSPDGPRRGQAAGTQEVEGRAKEMPCSHLDPGRGLSKSRVRESAPWPLAGLSSHPSEVPANFPASVDTVTSSS